MTPPRIPELGRAVLFRASDEVVALVERELDHARRLAVHAGARLPSKASVIRELIKEAARARAAARGAEP